jgi:hypothetical protein
MSTELVYLVISADKRVRVAKRPQIKADEIAIKVRLTYPAGWGRVLRDEITIDVPDFTPEVKYEQTAEPPTGSPT